MSSSTFWEKLTWPIFLWNLSSNKKKFTKILEKIAFLPFSFKTFSPSFNCRRFCSSTFQRVNNIGFEATNLRCKKCCEEACDLIYVFSDMIDSDELLIMLGWSAIRSFVPYLEAYFCFVNMSKEEFSICLFTYCQTNICEPEQIISLKVWSESLTEWDVWMWNWILEGVIKTWEQIEKKHKNTSSRSSKTAENSQVGNGPVCWTCQIKLSWSRSCRIAFLWKYFKLHFEIRILTLRALFRFEKPEKLVRVLM